MNSSTNNLPVNDGVYPINTVDDINSCTTHNKEYSIIPIVYGPLRLGSRFFLKGLANLRVLEGLAKPLVR